MSDKGTHSHSNRHRMHEQETDGLIAKLATRILELEKMNKSLGSQIDVLEDYIGKISQERDEALMRFASQNARLYLDSSHNPTLIKYTYKINVPRSL